MTLQPRQLELQGVPIPCWEAGSGESVVVLDGPSWDVGPLADALAVDYRVVRIDLSGLGQLPDGARPGSPEELGRLLGEAIRGTGTEHCTLIAASFASTAALWQTLAEPGGVEALVLMSPVAIKPVADASRVIPEDLVAHPGRGGSLPNGVSDDWRVLIQSVSAGVDDAELEGRLGEVGCATLGVFGLEDRLVSSEAARIYRERIPNCNVSLVYDAGHALLCDRPEAVVSAVADFVERRETFIVGRESGMINP